MFGSVGGSAKHAIKTKLPEHLAASRAQAALGLAEFLQFVGLTPFWRCFCRSYGLVGAELALVSIVAVGVAVQ